MAEVKQAGGRPVIDYTARDYESLLAQMRAQIPGKLAEWRDFANEADFGNVLLELFAHLGDILSFYQDRVANESYLGTARTRRSVIEHLRLIGYELGTAVPAAAGLALSVPATVGGFVTISKGDAFATKSSKSKPSVRFEYTGDTPLIIGFGGVPVDPKTNRRIFTGVPVEEGRLFAEEVLGVSDGTADQRFPLSHSGLILRPPGVAQTGQDITVVSRLGTTTDLWALQETLAFSQAAQRDFTVRIDDADQATVVFGDDTFGKIPPSGSTIVATYRTGGGVAGNVPPGAIGTIVDAPQLALLGATVANPEAATGGAEREDLDHAVNHAPAVFRSMRRAVTAADYEQIALSFKGVAKVRAVATGWNEVTLYVAPEGGGKVSDVLETNLRSFLEDKRMLSQIVEIADVDYVPVFVTAEVAVESFYVTADVVARVQAAAAELLAFDKVGFNENVYLSRFYDRCQDVPGVIFVNVTEFHRGDRPDPVIEPLGTISMSANEIPVRPQADDYRTGIKVVVVPARPR